MQKSTVSITFPGRRNRPEDAIKGANSHVTADLRKRVLTPAVAGRGYRQALSFLWQMAPTKEGELFVLSASTAKAGMPSELRVQRWTRHE
jgi:hypothetical protein